MKNVDGCDVIALSLKEIKEKHEIVVRKFDDLTWELYYNLVLINTEYLESEEDLTFDEIGIVCSDSVVLVNKVLDYQLIELDSFLKRMENPESDEEKPTDGSGDGEDVEGEGSGNEYDVVEQVTPSIVLETVVTGAKLIEASYEACENYVQINSLKTSFSEFESRLKEVLSLLLSKFTPEANPQDEHSLNFQNEELEEVKLVNHSLNAFFINDFNKLVEYWTMLDGLDQSSSRFMAEADSFQNFKDRETLSSQEQWIVINHINSNLKKAQELVKLELTQHINDKTNEVSSKVSKIIEILISRADNELFRSSFEDLESSIKNREILRQNTINLLKNGMNMSNTNCGLRETVSDRLKREKLRRECIIRLVVLTRESFQESDLIRNLGVDHYKAEVEDLVSNELYRGYFK